ncbi:MAG: hypothetical protein HY683_03665 [Chloroflexi bacterium]|nr:hypothetical protein [Chloroflexota bacterium]
MSTMKRLYFYGVAFVALVVAANGAALLLRYLLDLARGRPLVGSLTEQASVGLALVLVGAPVWALHWARAQHHTGRLPQETGAVLRKLYLYGTMFLAATIGFFMLRSLLRWALGVGTFDAIWPAHIVVWAAVWGYHWTLEQREGQPTGGARTVRRWYVYIVSGYGLGFMVSGIVGALSLLLVRTYDLMAGTPVLTGNALWSDPTRSALATLLVGGAWWAFHWLAQGWGDIESTLRQVYLYLFAFLGGAVTVLAVTAVMLYAVLRWALGAPGLPGATQHFRTLPQFLPALLVALALLLYHWQVVGTESGRLAGRLPGARRSFNYIMAFLGLGTLVTGVAILLGVLIGLAVRPAGQSLTAAEAWRTLLALALTLLVVGTPLWLGYWTRAQRYAREGGLGERGSLPRRIFIYGVLLALVLAVLGSLSAVLSFLLRDLLAGQLSLRFLRDGAWLLGTALTAGALLPYHWQVLREDQQAGAEAAPGRKAVTLAVGEGADELVTKLEEALGGRIRVLRLLTVAAPPALTPEELDGLARQVREAPADRVLLVAVDGAVRVYGYR